MTTRAGPLTDSDLNDRLSRVALVADPEVLGGPADQRRELRAVRPVTLVNLDGRHDDRACPRHKALIQEALTLDGIDMTEWASRLLIRAAEARVAKAKRNSSRNKDLGDDV